MPKMSYVEPAAADRSKDCTARVPVGLWNRVLGAATWVLVAMYGLVFILKPDQMFADDSYFYFQVAWNIARGMGSTFNTVMPTNGYHPLWMLVCVAVFKVFPERMVATHAIAGVIVLLDVATLLAARRILAMVGGGLWPVAFALFVPFCFLSQLGTEGALSGCLLALMMLAAYRLVLDPGRGHGLLFSLAGALAVLSRLDNIFIVGLVWLGVTVELWRGQRQPWLPFQTMPVYAVFWGAYLASNRIYFHTWQPISGLLKSHTRADHAFGSNLPHTGLLALAVIIACAAVLGIDRKPDVFSRTVEHPFAMGVLCHALYIVFRMSNETRWSWYYTSWMLLASVMLGRAGWVFIKGRRRLALPLASLCVLLLAALWVRGSWMHTYKAKDELTPASFNAVVYGRAGIHRAFAFDQPGRLAYHSDIEIIPLDGLMGDLKFQHDLTSMGVAEYIRVNHVDGLIGPPIPFNQPEYDEMCARIYLGSTQFHCAPYGNEPGRFYTSGVDVYARFPAGLAGTIPLKDDEVVWTVPGYVSVWKFPPQYGR